MNYKKEVLENKKIKFTAEIDAETFDKAIDEAYQKNKHKFAIEGFRRGKAPRKVIEKQYGKGVFFEDAVDIILPKAYSDILEQEKDLEIVSRPDVDVINVTDEGAVTVTYEVAVKPEVELGEYTGLEIKGEKTTVSKADVDEELKKAQDKASRLVDVTEDRPIAINETANINFVGSIDGVEFEGGKGDNFDLQLGSNMFIPGFEEQVVGMKAGEVKDVKVAFPKEYGAQEVAGKDAVFKVTLNQIKVKEVPELDDEFAKDVSEFDTLEDYKKDIKAKLKAEKEAKAEKANEEALIDAVVKNAKMDIPAEMTEYQAESMAREFEYRLQSQGMKLEDYLKYVNMTAEELIDQYKPSAEKTIRVRLTLEAIIAKENIVASVEEVEEQIAKYAEMQKKDVEEFKKTMDPRENFYIESDIKTEKVLKFLKDNNKIK